MVWLHGYLTVEIIEASNLPGERWGAVGSSTIGKYIESGLAKLNPADAYCVLDIHTPYQVSKSRYRTRVITSHNPKWNEKAKVDVADNAETLSFVLKDSDVVGADFIGTVDIPAGKVVSGELLSEVSPVLDKKGNQVHGATLKLAVQYVSVQAEAALYCKGIGRDGFVPNVYFPVRHGNRVRLYNDAHHAHTGPMDGIALASGAMYEEKSCWDELYADLQAAEMFIYVAGWSVVDHVTLLRNFEGPQQPGPTIGELLKQKADEQKLKVCMMVWDDATSTSVSGGVMGTKDQETQAFFKGSQVECVLCPRQSQQASLLRGVATSTMFTHHQKLVVMDAPPLPGQQDRRIIAYVGGLDLTTGRFDTPEHPLFATLHTAHINDFYQGCLPGADSSKGGPRQPWHDIHSRVEGPIAWDVMDNFTQRWQKQAGKLKQHKLLDFKYVRGLFVANRTNYPTGDPAVFVLPEADREAWNAQLFRSIDSQSVEGFPDDNAEANRLGLLTGKGITVERSIQQAYIYAIRRAQKYIYIENQYFLGSAQNWPDGEHPAAGCDHLVCVEIALKCVQKIQQGEPFCTYVIIPPFPEGDPTSGSVQEILYWQAQTMRMMYGMIAEALKAKGSTARPTDYLQFFFVGKREAPVAVGEGVPSTLPPAGSPYAQAQASRRHMIYVHSKLMICDDEYVLLGSANINQRSLGGSRDSEICVGAYQPTYTLEACGGQLPQGEVHGFRMALWKEHIGCIDPLFLKPSSQECARKVAAIAQNNFDVYFGEQVVSLPCGHIIRYPLDISHEGKVSNLPGIQCFPDTKASILGQNGSLPDALTT